MVLKNKSQAVKERQVELPRAAASEGGRIGVVLAYLACALIWGTTWYAVRVCVSPGGFEPYFAGAFRLSIASVLLGLLWAFRVARPGPPDGKALLLTLMAGLFTGSSMAFVYLGEQWISGGLASILASTAPLVTAVLLWATGMESVSRLAVFGSLVSLSGVILIYQAQIRIDQAQALGVVFVLASVLMAAISNLIIKRHASRQHPLATAGLLAVTGAALFWLFAIPGLLESGMPAFSPGPVCAVIYLAIMGSIVAFGSFLYLIKRVSLMAGVTLVFFPPMLAMGVDALFERSAVMSPGTFWGMGMTLAGVIVSLLLPLILKQKADL